MDAFWIILTGAMVATACGILGCYLVLRRMAMVGDAISHAVLPGIVIAFLISGSRDSVLMLSSAIITGIATTFIIQFLNKKGKLQADASIGVTFTWLFAIGVIMISAFAGKVDLDQDCVLYGEIAYVPLDIWIAPDGQNLGPRAVYIIGFVLILISIVIAMSYKELFITTFDPGFASVIGISVSLWHYTLMTMVSITTVASFELVGAILVIALIIAPPAAAYMLTDNLKNMMIVTVIIGITTSVLGYYFAVWINGSISGAMSTVAGIIFAITFLFAPKEGIVVKKLKYGF